MTAAKNLIVSQRFDSLNQQGRLRSALAAGVPQLDPNQLPRYGVGALQKTACMLSYCMVKALEPGRQLVNARWLSIYGISFRSINGWSHWDLCRRD